jgi:hypothetical protein
MSRSTIVVLKRSLTRLHLSLFSLQPDDQGTGLSLPEVGTSQVEDFGTLQIPDAIQLFILSTII